jgi:superfamily II DNA or RNA helicase
VVKLCLLAGSPFKGGLLGDPVGLGKSLTALVAALKIVQNQQLRGFILVVTRKSCMTQWVNEVRHHFKKVCLLFGAAKNPRTPY